MKTDFKNNELSFFKKITGTNFPNLAGLNKFKPRGDEVLSMLGYVKEDFDPFYTTRGALAEKLALKSLTKRGFNCVVYDSKKVGYDNFKDNPNFGGLIDIEIPSLNTLYEIKSRNIKDYEKIQKYGDLCQENQALHYGYLRNYKTVHIMWIFFDDETEKLLKINQPVTSYKNLKMFEKELVVDFNSQKQLHDEALNYYKSCIAKQAVPFDDISDKYLELLKWKRPDKKQ